jgi:hypothetical protein
MGPSPRYRSQKRLAINGSFSLLLAIEILIQQETAEEGVTAEGRPPPLIFFEISKIRLSAHLVTPPTKKSKKYASLFFRHFFFASEPEASERLAKLEISWPLI